MAKSNENRVYQRVVEEKQSKGKERKGKKNLNWKIYNWQNLPKRKIFILAGKYLPFKKKHS